MEQVELSNIQLDILAGHDKYLNSHYYAAVACDRLPHNPERESSTGYIVNTDPHDKPGQHWLALWTGRRGCEIMDSYGMPLEYFRQAEPLREWIVEHWGNRVKRNERQFQALGSATCGHYALLYLCMKAKGHSLREFQDVFKGNDFVANDGVVSEWLREKIESVTGWDHICKMRRQQCCSIKK